MEWPQAVTHWGEAPQEMRNTWFRIFGSVYTWDVEQHNHIYRRFKMVASARIRSLMHKGRETHRKKGRGPTWINKDVWDQMLLKWEEPRAQEIARQNRANREQSTSHYAGGPIPAVEHLHRLEVRGLSTDPLSLFEATHTRRGPDGRPAGWIDERAESTASPVVGVCSSGIRGTPLIRCTHRQSHHVIRSSAVESVLSREKDSLEIFSQNGNGGLRGKLNKVVLAYSGGLDTSVIVPWLRESYGCDVVCFTADVGQGVMEMDGLEAKAKASGASQLIVKDLKEEFVKDYVFPCLRAGAIFERKYLLGTSMARPVIAKAMVDVAKEVGADAVSHGCTGKGNDQVRFELTFFALNPELQVVAPWREWEITGREDAIEYAKKHNIPVPVSKKSIYSRDRNLWHLSHEGDILEDPANEPKKDMYMMSADPEDAPNRPEYLEIGIVSGIPTSINGKELSPAALLAELNEIGGRHGIGRVDMVENRLVGMKSRGVYETPGGTILFTAARGLESLTLDRDSLLHKDMNALKYAELVYNGRWFDPLRHALDKFMEDISKTTTGSVTLKLYKGSATVTSMKSPYSLFRQDISSFENGAIYNQADAAGFIRLYGLPTRVRAMLKMEI